MLHVQRNVLNAKRRPSEITLEAHGDSSEPESNKAGIQGACEFLEVGCPLFDLGEQVQRRRPRRPDSCTSSGMNDCVAGSTRGNTDSASPRRLHSRNYQAPGMTGAC